MATERKEVVWHGLMVGLIGYASIAVSVSIGDLVQRRSFFYTVSLLGEWLFYGLNDPSKLEIWPGPVFAYNGLHCVTFIGFGLVASWLASMSERGPLYWYAALVMYLFIFVHMFAAVMLMTEPLRAVIPMWQIWVPSLLAVTGMSLYLLRVHPQLRREMSEWTDDTEHDPAGDSPS